MSGGGRYLIAYVGGLLLGARFESQPLYASLPLLVALCGAPLLFWRSLRQYTLFLFPPLCLLLLGIAQYQLATSPSSADRYLLSRSGQEVVVEGVVTNVDIRHDGRVRCDLQVISALEGEQTTTLGAVPIRLHIWEDPPPLRVGQRLRTTVTLRQPRNFGIPGEFDYVRFLARRGIFVTGTVANGAAVAVLNAPPVSLSTGVSRWREQVAGRISSSLPPPLVALTRALVLGDHSGIAPAERQLLAGGGVAHLFAVSGLHLGLVAGWIYALLLSCWRRSEYLLLVAPPVRFLPLAVLPFLAVYLSLAGSGMSLQRALLMFSAGAVLVALHRRTAALQLLTTVVLVLLLIDPLALFEPSLQLSVAGVAGIVVAFPRWRTYFSFRSQLLRLLTDLFLVTLAATLATAPLVVWHFHQLSFLGLLTNLVAVPLIGGTAVPLALLGAIVTPFSGDLADIAFGGCGLMLAGMLAVVKLTLQTFPASGFPHYFSAGQVLCCALICWGTLAPAAWRTRNVVAVLLLLSIHYGPPQRAAAEVTLLAFSVGQGASFLLSFPDERHYLIDGGGLYGDNFDVGERLLAPALGALGVKKLAAVVLTHNHPDHYKGLTYLLKHFPVAAFWYGGDVERFPAPLRAVLAEMDIPQHNIAAGWTALPVPPPLSFSVWAPDGVPTEENDRSLVLYAATAADGLLLTGDLASEGVAALLRSEFPGPVSLMKLPHHGSRYSHPFELVDVLQPKRVFASLGFANRYGFPNAEVLRGLSERSIPFYRTDLDGTLSFSSRGYGWQVKCWKKQAFY